jgi:predicted Zn-dependent protease with MMP-like domain
MKKEIFEQLVEEGIGAIPEKFRRLIENAAIVIEDEPEGGGALFGLYEGIPKVVRGSNYTSVLPDKITIFMNPIVAEARDEEEIREIIRDTVWHEIAHHFGFSEKEVCTAERRRRRKTKL